MVDRGQDVAAAPADGSPRFYFIRAAFRTPEVPREY
jgi:hypothetical protein